MKKHLNPQIKSKSTLPTTAQMSMYAEVILPLPLYSTFTYAVPAEMEDEIHIGSRVLVQFGTKKYYTGIVDATHSRKPEKYNVKELMAVLDPRPIVRHPQIKLWKWIAEYYLCSVGEVYKAALPTGLKPESETFISFSDDFEIPEGIKLSELESQVVVLLQSEGKKRIADIEKDLGLSSRRAPLTRVINRLLDAGIINIDERVTERYRPKCETYVELNAERGDDGRLHDFMNLTSRARQQEKALLGWLDLSDWLHRAKDVKDVSRAELLKSTGVTPGVLKSMIDKGIFRTVKKTVNRFMGILPDAGHTLPILSDAQKKALDEIRSGFAEHDITLLHGVTGSGKTEIYSHLIRSAMHDGNQVLYLVPEISLTTQLTDRLRRIFGDRLIVYHSKFSDTERVEIWKRLLTDNSPLLILGVRSSVLLPFAKLGLIIVDEEHESSFKQYDPAPRYNARDTAMVLATMHGAKTLLGSATPSIETYYKSVNGKYGLVTLSERYRRASLPGIEVVDMREQRKKKLVKGMLSEPMRHALERTMAEGNQAIMFQNRRGFAPVVVCQQCGWTPKCPNCDVSPVYHKHSELLRCHYCGYSTPLPRLCPACGQNSIDIFGYGTERIAEELHHQFENSRVSRMDLDTTRNKNAYQEIIEEFAGHDTDILVGTQMVSKGLDFDKVKLVGVANADTLLNFPDYRSNERAFNMLTQVAGRAGRRSDSQGNVVIQTTQPENPVLKFVKSHDYISFYTEEIEERRRYAYPPFARIINVYLKNHDAYAADMGAVTLAKALRNVFGNRVLGPERPFVSRIAKWNIQSIMLKIEAGASMKKVKDLIRSVYAGVAQDPNIKSSMIYFDVDPS